MRPLIWISRLNPVWLSGLARLGTGGVTAALLDLNLPDSQGIETLSRVQSEFPEIPVIVLTGQEDEAIAVDAVKHGAQDYLFKGMVDGNLLVRSYTLRHRAQTNGGRPY